MKKFILNAFVQVVREVINEDVVKRIDRLEQRMDRFEQKVDERIDKLEQKMDKRMDGLEQNFQALAEDIANIKGNLEGEARAFHIAGYLKNQASFGD
jgi:chaperonin cofactor prefoldin